MQERTPLDPSEQDLEAALVSLTPAPTEIHAGAIWYRAALSRERRRANRWRAAAAIAILVTSAALIWRPKPEAVTADRIVVVREQAKPDASPVPTSYTNADRGTDAQMISTAYLRIREQLVRYGPQRLPATAAGDANDGNIQHAWSPPGKSVGVGLTPGF